MLVESFRDKLLVDSCCRNANGGIIEIPNSVRERELKKVWVDCSGTDEAILIRLEEKKDSQLCPLFRRTGLHLKTCDGIILLKKDARFHAVFCELKTSWDAAAIKQIRNSHLFFRYAHSVAAEWHGAPAEEVTTWFAVLTQGPLPVRKYSTSFKASSIPPTYKPSKNVQEPRRLQVTDQRGLRAERPLSILELASI